ncbi:hypothetical protein KAI87_17465, partial [Myxococcota bacterium]|nr:hypothetical protein [Myxococcota bacterium]
MEIKEGEPLIVEEICFKGDPRVEKSFLLSELYTQRGKIWNQELMERDEKHLWELYREHNFLNAELGDTLVEINQQKAKIAFNIQAGDRVALEFEGNHIIRSRKLRELYRASSEKLDSTALSSLRRRIKRAYVELGHFHTSIKLETIRDSAQRITRHHFIIDEEKPLRVTQIRFQGAKEFEPELLERQIRAVLDQSLRNNAFFQAVTDNDLNEVWQGEGSSDKNQYAAVKADQRWIPHLYNRAIEEIENAYRMRGYSEIKVGPVIPKYFKNSNVEIRIPVVEGPQTRVEAISFRGNEAIQAYDLLSTAGDISGRESTKIAPGEPLTHMAVENARINLTRLYRDRGFLYSRLFTTVDRSTDRKRADITFHIEEGPQVRIARILIKG